MKTTAEKIEIAKQLQAEINALQGLGKVTLEPVNIGLAPFAVAFPGNTFPTGTVHEFISYEAPTAASTNGFITAIIGNLIRDGGLCLWITGDKKIFPHGLRHFGLKPDQIVFINASRPKEALWIIEEALKCEALTAVIGEVKELGFTDSRRLQLAVERSGVTGFIHRHCPRSENAVACTTRWKISPLPGYNENDLPGVGHTSWDIQLLKVRNGRPYTWQMGWLGNSFTPLAVKQIIALHNERHTG